MLPTLRHVLSKHQHANENVIVISVISQLSFSLGFRKVSWNSKIADDSDRLGLVAYDSNINLLL